MSIKTRLSGLEKAANEAAEPEPPWSPPEVYARLREDAREEIERDSEIGVEPLFWIDDEGTIHATDDGSVVRHLGNYVQATDREIARLNHEIKEAEADMTPEQLARSKAEEEESKARSVQLVGEVGFDEAIRVLEAEIASLKAEIAEDEGGGGGR